jgi:hypothetical protein
MPSHTKYVTQRKAEYSISPSTIHSPDKTDIKATGIQRTGKDTFPDFTEHFHEQHPSTNTFPIPWIPGPAW